MWWLESEDHSRLGAFALVSCLVSSLVCGALSAGEAPVRAELITMVEVDLSEAYSFPCRTNERLPDFEKLDRIYPTWHLGDPAVARRYWLKTGYRYHRVFYRVDYVRSQGEFRAEIGGKKLVVWTKNREAELTCELWPFQYWPWAEKCESEWVDCDYAIYALKYKLEARKSQQGGWTIVRERTDRRPIIPPEARQECSFEKQLLDWCPRCSCPADGAPGNQDQATETQGQTSESCGSEGCP
jgi:hypothetical protein